MCAVEQAIRVQNLKVFANGDLGGVEGGCQFINQHPTFAVNQLEDSATAFFV